MKTNLIFLFPLSLFLFFCSRTKEGFVGPKKVAALPGFQCSTVQHFTYNSSTGISTEINTSSSTKRITLYDVNSRYYLKAQFSQEVTWQLEIFQPRSGAKKIITGTSSYIDASNAIWDGTTSNNILFSDLADFRQIIVTLSFLESDVTHTMTLGFRGAPAYYGYDKYMAAHGSFFLLVDDFEGNSTATAEWQDKRLRQEYSDAADGVVILENSYSTAAEGFRSFHLKGTDHNKNAYIGGVNTFSLESLTNGTKSLIPDVDPSDVYLNLFVQGTGQSTLQLKVYELENLQNYQNVNPNFVYNSEAQKNNDAWTYDLTVNWTGWKLVSVRYSDFKRADNPDLGGNGNGVREPNRISGLAITLTSLGNYTSGDVFVDYVNFTTYHPMIP